MKLYYFTGTGNTLWTAREIQKKFQNCELINIAKLDENKDVLVKDECIGILFPVYVFGTPLIVNRFIKRLKVDKNTYIFSVATYGGLLSQAIYVLKNELEQAGLWLDTGFGVNLPGNCISYYDVKNDVKIEKMFEKAYNKIEIISKAIINKEKNIYDKNIGILGKILSNKMYPNAEKTMHETDKIFFTDNNCTLCGTCLKICPVNNITIQDNKVKWNHKCEQCYACINWCPNKSIQGNKKTSKRKRYHNREIKKEDIIIESKNNKG